MIHPSCLEVLATVQSAFKREIVPHLKDVEARSTGATIEHLLRHVALRIEQEGALLTIDIERLTALLQRIAPWMEATGVGQPSAIRSLLAEEAAAKDYRNLDQLGAAALQLRGALVEAQALLQERDASDPEAAAIRAAVRTYIGEQLVDEAKLIEPAFSGQGPRR